MSEESIQGIRSEYGREQTEIMHRYGDNVDEIVSKGSEDIQHRDRMTAGQVDAIMREQQQAEIAECAHVARTQLKAAHDSYEKRIAERAEAVRSELFGNIEDTAALARAATATEDELREMMELASFTGNQTLGKVAFTVAARKGYGDLLNTYLNEIDGGARGLFEEWTQIPSQELLARQREDLERIVTTPDRPHLMPRVSVR